MWDGNIALDVTVLYSASVCQWTDDDVGEAVMSQLSSYAQCLLRYRRHVISHLLLILLPLTSISDNASGTASILCSTLTPYTLSLFRWFVI